MKTHIDLDYEELKAVVDNYKPGKITKSNTIIKYLEANKYIKIKEWLNFDPEQTYYEKVIPLMDEYCVLELQKILKIFYDLYPEINPERTEIIDQVNNKEYIIHGDKYDYDKVFHGK